MYNIQIRETVCAYRLLSESVHFDISNPSQNVHSHLYLLHLPVVDVVVASYTPVVVDVFASYTPVVNDRGL